MQLSFDDKYKILTKRDSAYEGLFIVAVKTTKIFCKPVCSARTPLRENVTFYDTADEAIENGFRPCKKCKPLERVSELPSEFKKLLDGMHANPEQRIKDADLLKMGLEPAQLRRWFKKYYNTTFQSYQRSLRMNAAFQQISSGDKISSAAYDAGFESLSGFSERFRSTFGKAPSDSKATIVISLKQFTTPLGPMYGGATADGVCFIEFFNRVKFEEELTSLCKELNAVILQGDNVHLTQLEKELNEYFDKKRIEFTVPLVFTGTEFQKSVWKMLLQIPYGKTWSYKQQAIKLKNLPGIRAIASANGKNKHAIIVPCHRVVGSDGSLTGYAAGVAKKEWLLKLETGIDRQAPELPF